MVLGEAQILGQMKEAVRQADAAGGLGACLHQMFQRTFAVAKEVRSTTEIGAHSVSMAAAAVRLSQRIFDKISEQHVLFIGAGEMIELCATHFAAQKPEIADQLPTTAPWNAPNCWPTASMAKPSGWPSCRSNLPTSTSSSPAPPPPCRLSVLGWSKVRSRRAGTSRYSWSTWPFRAISKKKPAASTMSSSTPWTIFGTVVQTGTENRQAAVAQAEAIIETRVQNFMHWVDSRSVVPLIQDLHESGETMRMAELERARKMLARGEDADAVLEALSRGLTAKFMHGPQQALHNAQGDERARLAALLPQLFRTKR